jgi:hypothetical protein
MLTSELHRKVKEGGISKEHYLKIRYEILFGSTSVDAYVNEMLGMQLFMWYQRRLCTGIHRSAVEIRNLVDELKRQAKSLDIFVVDQESKDISDIPMVQKRKDILAKIDALKWVLGEIDEV